MRLDWGLVLGVILDCAVFIFYADTLFYRKHSKTFVCAAAVLGHIIHFITCLLSNVAVNLISFVVINAVLLKTCFYLKNKTAAFQVGMLTALSIASEFAAVYICRLGINAENLINISSAQSMILTAAGKALYIAGIMILAAVSRGTDRSVGKDTDMQLIIISVLTMVILMSVFAIPETGVPHAAVCIACMTIDLSVFMLGQKISLRQTENEALKKQARRNKMDFEAYTAIRNLNHDISEHLNVLSELIGSDNEQAAEYIQSLNERKRQTVDIVEYTDNYMVNLVLSKKMEECRERDIKFILAPVAARLDFLDDMDSVSIFSNIINNAIEGCGDSEKRVITMRIYTFNNNFVVVKVRNTTDKKPLVIEGQLKTHKDNEKLHGIGLSSVRQTLKKYGGDLTWSYDEAEKVFCSMAVIQHMDNIGA